jgi:hypothetical protein
MQSAATLSTPIKLKWINRAAMFPGFVFCVDDPDAFLHPNMENDNALARGNITWLNGKNLTRVNGWNKPKHSTNYTTPGTIRIKTLPGFNTMLKLFSGESKITE